MRGLYLLDPSSGEFTRYHHRDNDSQSLRVNFIFSLYEDSRNNFWVGTDGGGLHLMDRQAGTFKTYRTVDGLADNVVAGIIEDQQGFLWVGTQKGISRFDVDAQVFRNFDKRHGLADNLFNRNTPQLLDNGELFFGHSKGFILFDPQAIVTNRFTPPVVLTNLLILNQPMGLGVADSPLTQAIGAAKSITLKHTDSMFTLEFAALNFQMSDENKYRYRLIGFDKNWIDAGSKRTATYTNLDAGDYVFEVKGSNNDGIWGENVASLKISILPPWWLSFWAYAGYFCIVLLLLYWLWRAHQLKLVYEQKKVEQERSLVRRLQQVDKLKDEFLANTSHELRTPLNGIIGLAESLNESMDETLSQQAHNSLKLIAKSGKRLAVLVDDILDFAKLKNKALALNKKAVDIRVLVDVVASLSRPLMVGKPIVLRNQLAHDLPPVYADEDRLLQIFHNLIGNAIKFTHQGSINIYAERKAQDLVVTVEDTGIGIEPEQCEKIFQVFHQVEGHAERAYSGAGLGLSISKQLIELHGGTISVASSPGQGSRFTFNLPFTFELPDSSSRSESDVIEPSDVAELAEPELATHAASQRQKLPTLSIKLGHILVVDDDPVNRLVVSNYLELRNYRVSEAESGEEALAFIAEQQDVDLVLLDIMMPKMSGYETCKRLRALYQAYELPIIFLTARSQTNDLVLGFELGANDFLTKPIGKEELLARVATHMQLHGATTYLDKKVAERTEELHKKNEGLKQAQAELEQAYKKLEEASLTDPLTGLHNRRFLAKSMAADISMVDREYKNWKVTAQAKKETPSLLSAPILLPENHDLIFMLLDVDYFKSVNDEYGHSAGDKILEQLSRLLEVVLRDSDYLVRWGGEEFLIVARFCSRAEAPEMAERIRLAVASFQFDIGGGQMLTKSCSLGYAVYPFYPLVPTALTWEQVVDTADRAMYLAKKSGRNCWVGIGNNKEDSAHINPALNKDLVSLVASGTISVVSSIPNDDIIF